MASVTISHPVVLKAIVTGQLKADLVAELTQRSDEIETEIQQLEEYKNRTYSEMAKTDIQRAMALRRQIEAAKRQKEHEKEEASRMIEGVQALTEGEEVIREVLEGLSQVNVGDNLREVRFVEIVVKDDVVQDIRVAETPPPVARRTGAAQPSAAAPAAPISLLE